MTQDQVPDEIKVKTAFKGEFYITYISPDMKFEALVGEIKDTCRFPPDARFTVKWVDEEGDPCTLSTQEELQEAIRLYEVNKDSEITIHVFPGVPPAPGMPCAGEDRSIYRRGARRWRKLYKVNGHIFQAKRFNRSAACAYCQDRIWGLGRQGFKCTQCKLLIHKKCHKLLKKKCTGEPVAPTHLVTDSANGERDVPSPEADSVVPPTSAHIPVPIEDTLPPPSAATEVVSVDAPSADLEPGGQRQYSLADFELIRVIGRGSYAKVLMVELKRTKRVYAMKVIKKELVTDDEDIDWVQTEKHVFETASNHPFLVGLHSCFQSPSRLFFVIEFVRGGDLMFHMQRQRKLPEEHAKFYTAEICLALNFLHERGIIYRDLKLDNVLIDHEGHIKLTDYGMCKEGIRQGDSTSTFCGTPNYIAPEILRGEDYGFSVDWWALGVLMYEMLAGRSPFDIGVCSESPDQNTEDYLFQVILEKTIRIPRSLSVKACSILKGFLNKNPGERLGCHPETGFQDIVNHPFFKSIDWELESDRQDRPERVRGVRVREPAAHVDGGLRLASCAARGRRRGRHRRATRRGRPAGGLPQIGRARIGRRRAVIGRPGPPPSARDGARAVLAFYTATRFL
ncbi:atypical protein kinase C-like isoform X1 [Amphibalanus amphitrite]|uniref:atypical protein kinase C-like isoform X1 n=1 Tax=Amphibalanus amphitrite TaxID=1232801 RepID=UPI001C91C426|nr:atypical protein kinase C-like isoform X1 [Amphibalanus amphitrite]XP_043229048.1 atypical protein kinase C-like isoform X1 [Amphibalanus amphitrite]